MNQIMATVLSNGPVMEGANMMWLRSPELAREAKPGQFLLVRCDDGVDPLLRRALSIHRVGRPFPGQNIAGCALLYNYRGSGTERLRRLREGDTVDVIGPLGKGFTMKRTSKNLLLIGVSWGISPLIALAEQQVALGRSVTLVMGAATGAQLYPSELFPPEVELVVATEDASAGQKGSVTDLAAEYWFWADEVYASGPISMYAGLSSATARLWPRKAVQVLAEMPMACGVGACYACTIITRRGPKLSCRDGPRFYLSDLLL